MAASLRPAAAQSSRDQAEAHTLYAQANHQPMAAALRAGLTNQSSGFFGDGTLQPGALRTFDGRYRPVPGLRYHAGLRLLEAQDSINTRLDPPLARGQPARLRPGRARQRHAECPAPLPPAPGEGRQRRHSAASSSKCSPPSMPGRCCWPGSTPAGPMLRGRPPLDGPAAAGGRRQRPQRAPAPHRAEPEPCSLKLFGKPGRSRATPTPCAKQLSLRSSPTDVAKHA